MISVTKKIKHKLLAWAVLMLLCGIAVWLGWRGVLWFNMPSRRRYAVRGVDVSHYQREIDWHTLAAQDLSFAFIKATEGSGSVDDYFVKNWLNAKAEGLYVGGYHFFSFDSPGDTQAQIFTMTVPKESDALPPVIDLEHYRSSDLPPVEKVQENLRVMLERLSDFYGKKPIIYTTESCWETYLKDTDLQYTLWIRSVYEPPSNKLTPAWAFWQYNSRGRLDGYSGGETLIDLNVYRGTLDDMRNEFYLYSKK